MECHATMQKAGPWGKEARLHPQLSSSPYLLGSWATLPVSRPHRLSVLGTACCHHGTSVAHYFCEWLYFPHVPSSLESKAPICWWEFAISDGNTTKWCLSQFTLVGATACTPPPSMVTAHQRASWSLWSGPGQRCSYRAPNPLGHPLSWSVNVLRK